MTREELKEHCKRQVQQFERVEKIMPVTPNDWKRYEEHKLILELLEQEPKTGHWIEHPHEAGLCWEFSRYECSECHVWAEDDSDYCPNCGAKMAEPQESEDKMVEDGNGNM